MRTLFGFQPLLADHLETWKELGAFFDRRCFDAAAGA